MTSTGCRPLERLDEDAAIAHRQVGALDEREAEIARQVRVLEVGLVVGPGRQQDDRGRLLVRRRERAQRVALRAEEGGEPLNLGTRGTLPAGCAGARCGSRARSPRPTAPACDRRARPTRRRARARDRRRAGAGRCRAARECRGTGAGTRDWRARAAAAEARSAGAAAARRDRQDQVEEPGPLDQPGFETAPLVGRHDERDHVELPRPVDALRVAVDVVGDAVLADGAARAVAARGELLRAQRLDARTNASQCGRSPPVPASISSKVPAPGR